MMNQKAASLIRMALVGQPNCGKSTLFNQVAGYRSISTNFAGATVTLTSSRIQIENQTIELIDLPGLYSLTAIDLATEATKQYLLFEKIDLVINVIDGVLLCRSLELTLQMAELGLPMIICLNMMDEAQRKGIHIDSDQLSTLLGIPVIPAIAAKGLGIDTLFKRAIDSIAAPSPVKPQWMSKHVETSIARVRDAVVKSGVPPDKSRLIAIKLIENDPYYWNLTLTVKDDLRETVVAAQKELEQEHDQSSDQIISAERHTKAMELFEGAAQVVSVSKGRWREKIDDWLMHPVLGYLVMAIFLYSMFVTVFKLGAGVEKPILLFFQSISTHLHQHYHPHSLGYTLINSMIQGFSGGFSIVLPYLFPFLLIMAIIEDVGYLPRMAFLADSIMHRIGLHGTAVIPLLLGYGCTVPAIMATRIISSSRDRFIASTLTLLVPCSARMTLILGLVGYYLGGQAAFALYLFNMLVILVIGVLLSKLAPEQGPGMIMEIPSYKLPSLKAVFAKTWLRMKDFIIIAWPLLIVGSLILSLTEWLQWQDEINALLSPLTKILDLPEKVGLTIVFGILRKELSLLMLFQSLGTTDVLSVMSATQVIVFTVFIVFYLPCLATFGIMVKELGLRKSIYASLLSFTLAVILAWVSRFAYSLFI